MIQDRVRPEQLQAIESRLQAELKAASEGYNRAKLQFEEARDLADSQGLAHPESTHALSSAARDYGDALVGYSEAMKRFTDFILRGKLPPE
jgi:hypothetical protein